MIRVAIVGLGRNGQAHLKVHVKSGKSAVTLLCDRNEDRLREARQIAPGVQTTTDDDFWDDPNVDAVSINTGDCFHEEPFVKAMQAGKHVFIEKPVANSIEQIETMYQAWHAAGRSLVVGVGYVRRWDPLFRAVHQLCVSGKLGKVYYFEADYIHNLCYQKNQTDPVTGHNWYLEQEQPMVGGGSHPLDLLRWFSGREVVEASAYAGRFAFREMKNEDCQVALYRFDDGAIAKVAALYGPVTARPEACNLRVYGTEGTVEQGQVAIRSSEEEVHPAYRPIAEPLLTGHPFDEEILDWLDAIERQRQPVVPFWDGANSTLATLFAVKALKEGSAQKVPHIDRDGEWIRP